MKTNVIKEPKIKNIIPIKTIKDEKKAAQNAEYLAKIDNSWREIEEGKIVEVSAEEMRRILSE